MGLAPLSGCGTASQGLAMDDWLHILVALLVLVVPIAMGWLALKWSDRRERKSRQGVR